MATQTIDATLFASTHPDIVKRTSVSKLIISFIMLAAGILVFAYVFSMTDASSTVSMALMVLGTALILYGIFCLFWKSKELVYVPTGSTASQRSLFYDLQHLTVLKNLIEQNKMDAETAVKSEGSGNVRLDVLMSKDGKFAALQLFQYVPYTYTAVTPVKYFSGEEAASVAAFLCKS